MMSPRSPSRRARKVKAKFTNTVWSRGSEFYPRGHPEHKTDLLIPWNKSKRYPHSGRREAERAERRRIRRLCLSPPHTTYKFSEDFLNASRTKFDPFLKEWWETRSGSGKIEDTAGLLFPYEKTIGFDQNADFSGEGDWLKLRPARVGPREAVA